jgi:hypothetical protein
MKRISFKDNVFRCVEGAKEIARTENKSQQWVIIGCSSVYRSFYGDQNNIICWSSDSRIPDADVDTPVSKSCMHCENDVKGSGQGNSRACRFHRRLAVVMANHMSGQIYQVILSAISVFGKGQSGRWPLDSYAEFLKGNNVALSHVVSEAQFDLDSKFPKLIFTPVRSLTEEEYTIIENQMLKEETKGVLKLSVPNKISNGFTPVNPELSNINH